MTLYLAILQLALPFVMIVWLSIGRPARRLDLVARIAAAWIVLFGIAAAGVWLALPIATVAVLTALVPLASIAGSTRFRRVDASTGRVALLGGRIGVLAAAAFGIWAGAPAVAGWREPPNAVDLAFLFGDAIRVGQLLGAVGNSGNTDEPQLHIHAQRPGSANAPLAGAPLHLTFDGRFPVRNLIFGAVR